MTGAVQNLNSPMERLPPEALENKHIQTFNDTRYKLYFVLHYNKQGKQIAKHNLYLQKVFQNMNADISTSAWQCLVQRQLRIQ